MNNLLQVQSLKNWLATNIIDNDDDDNRDNSNNYRTSVPQFWKTRWDVQALTRILMSGIFSVFQLCLVISSSQIKSEEQLKEWPMVCPIPFPTTAPAVMMMTWVQRSAGTCGRCACPGKHVDAGRGPAHEQLTVLVRSGNVWELHCWKTCFLSVHNQVTDRQAFVFCLNSDAYSFGELSSQRAK